jgi:hypothetical protein
MNRNGFTLTELLICVLGIGVILGILGIIYVIAHFLAKVW